MNDKCPSCGAAVSTQDACCAFCGQATKMAAHAQAQMLAFQQQANFQRAAHEHHHREVEIGRSARLSIIFSIVGIVTCCVPIASVIGIVLGWRARLLARENGAPMPASAMIGAVVGSLTLIFGLGIDFALAWSIHTDHVREEELRAQTATSSQATQLSQTTACALAELFIREHGFQGKKSLSRVSCDGRIQQDNDKAVLETVRIQQTDGVSVRDACLRRGERWYVTDLSQQGSCFAVPSTVSSAGHSSRAGSTQTDR